MSSLQASILRGQNMSLGNELAAHKRAIQLWQEQNQQLKERNSMLTIDRDKYKSLYGIQLEERDARIAAFAQLEKALDLSIDAIAAKDDAIAAKDRVIAGKDRVIAGKDDIIELGETKFRLAKHMATSRHVQLFHTRKHINRMSSGADNWDNKERNAEAILHLCGLRALETKVFEADLTLNGNMGTREEMMRTHCEKPDDLGGVGGKYAKEVKVSVDDMYHMLVSHIAWSEYMHFLRDKDGFLKVVGIGTQDSLSLVREARAEMALPQPRMAFIEQKLAKADESMASMVSMSNLARSMSKDARVFVEARIQTLKENVEFTDWNAMVEMTTFPFNVLPETIPPAEQIVVGPDGTREVIIVPGTGGEDSYKIARAAGLGNLIGAVGSMFSDSDHDYNTKYEDTGKEVTELADMPLAEVLYGDGVKQSADQIIGVDKENMHKQAADLGLELGNSM